MKTKVNLNPMPAVRMTQNSKYYGLAAEYVSFKSDLAQELRLHLLGDVRGGKVEMSDKPDRNSLPIKDLLKLEVLFERQDQRNVDIDNLLKMVMDVLQTAGIIYNDQQVREVAAKVKKGVPEGNFSFTLSKLPQ